jgi:hypothetical protein
MKSIFTVLFCLLYSGLAGATAFDGDSWLGTPDEDKTAQFLANFTKMIGGTTTNSTSKIY